MISVPQAFFDNPMIRTVLRQGQTCIIRKETKDINPNNERYVAAHALTIVHRGQLIVQAPDDDRFVVKPGEMILIPRGIYMISDVIPHPDSFQATVLFFDDALLEDFLEVRRVDLDRKDETHQSCKTFPFTTEYQPFVDNLLTLYSANSHPHLAPLKIQEFLHLVSDQPNGPAFLQELRWLTGRKRLGIKSFMEQHFDKPLKIEDYAYLTGRSVSTFHRDFKRQFGMGPKNWLISQRLTQAKSAILSNPDLSVTSLAFTSGYENVSYFIKAFQKEFGISPKQFQMQVRDHTLI